MKNKDILLDVIGDIDDDLVPEINEQKKNKSIIKWTAIGSVCAAVIIACIMLLPSENDSGNTSIPSTNQPDSSRYESVVTPPTENMQDVVLLASPIYPIIPQYPAESDVDAYGKWSDAVRALRKQPPGYKNGFNTFFATTTPTFLADTENENAVYSPLSLYMALSMSAEISSGNTRQQILDLLSQDSIDSLRSDAKSVWQANYMDDGMATCVLATSLWTNNCYTYNQATIDTLAENYYSSVFTGDPSSDEYNSLYQSWLNEQTDNMLSDYVEGIRMNPETILSLASTVNYCGKWNDKFDGKLTENATFHSPNGDVECEFMNDSKNTAYYWGENFSATSLSLENNGQIRFILPDEDVDVQELFNDGEVLGFMLNTGEYQNSKHVIVNMSVPKFDISSGIDLTAGLVELGITDLFSSEASDFSPLSDSIQGVAVDKVEQDTRVMIDEDGCKAASLTVMILAGATAPTDKVDFTLDRPFIFEIVSETGLPLFVGIVNNPTER